jgi:signal transduction histidine kinase
MTRRIGLAIFLTVWAALLASGAVAYLTTRSVLLADLDAAILARAASLPVVSDARAYVADPADRFLVRDDRGRTIARPTTSEAVTAPEVVGASFATLGDGRRVRTLAVRLARPGGAVTVVYSGSTGRFDAVLRRLVAALTVAAIAGGAVAAGVAVWVARTTLRPLRATADAIGAIDESRLHRRIAPADLPRELVPVAQRLNEMLARLEQATGQRQRFLADAAHELRTPIAAIVTGAEVALRRPRGERELRDVLSNCLHDARVLDRVAGALLEHVRADRPSPDERVQVIEAEEVVEGCVRTAAAVAAAKGVSVTCEVPAGLTFLAAPWHLRSVLLNLLSNAVQYTPAGGEVQLQCSAENESVVLTIRDNGVGIAPEDLPRVFEPFFRTDGSRRQEPEHHLGLGLYLVKSHVKAMGGCIELASRPGEGTVVRVLIPAAGAVRPGDDVAPVEPLAGTGRA